MGKEDEVYKQLEERMLGYLDLINIPIIPCGEKMVEVVPSKMLSVSPIDPNMEKYTGNKIFVREAVCNKLISIADKLHKYQDNMTLDIVYGYRALNIQRDLFEKYKLQIKKFNPTAKESDLLEAVHRLVAVPEVSGHPTGGAVDVRIMTGNRPLDMGTGIWEFVKDSYSFSPFISKQQKSNRNLLREVMLTEGFAPFDGEWWHYSYGDREWTKYYDKPAAIYDQIEFSI